MEIREITEILLAAGVGGIIVEAIRGLRQRKKMGADYADVIASSAIKLLEPLEERVQEMRTELDKTKLELKDAKRELTAARAELRTARGEIRKLTQKLADSQRGGEL